MLVRNIKTKDGGLAQIFKTEDALVLYVHTNRLKAKYVVLAPIIDIKAKTQKELEAAVRKLEAERAIAAVARRIKRSKPLYKEVEELLRKCRGYVTVDELAEALFAGRSSVERALKRLGVETTYVIHNGRRHKAVVCAQASVSI